MRYTALTVHLRPFRTNAAVLELAASLARRFEARVTGVLFTRPVQVSPDGSNRDESVERLRLAQAEAVEEAEMAFRSAFKDRPDHIAWRTISTFGPQAGHLADEARSSDLLILEQDRLSPLSDPTTHVDIGDLVMQAGRPVLVAPPTLHELALDHVVLAWSDARASRRAATDALPLLKAAKAVTVLELAAEADRIDAEAHLVQVQAWLAGHGVTARILTAPREANTASQIRSLVETLKGDLIVAGAYGHSRMQEWVLGGVTQDLLLRSDGCVLLSH